MDSPRRQLDLSSLLTYRSTPTPRVDLQHQAVVSGGFPDELFHDLPEQERKQLECNICYQVACDPRKCTNSHIFCASCIYVWTVSQSQAGDARSKCPVCRGPGVYRTDLKIAARLSTKKVKCPVPDCHWAGKLSGYYQHRRTKHPTDADGRGAVTKNRFPPIISSSLVAAALSNLPGGVAGQQQQEQQQTTSSWSSREEDAGHVPRAENLFAQHQRSDTRRSRLENMFDMFSAQLRRRHRSIDRLYEDQERTRRSQLQQVERLGRRLDHVSTDLVHLLDNMSRDSQRFEGYIRGSQNLEESLLHLGNNLEGGTLLRPTAPPARSASRPARRRPDAARGGEPVVAPVLLTTNANRSTGGQPSEANRPPATTETSRSNSQKLLQRRS